MSISTFPMFTYLKFIRTMSGNNGQWNRERDSQTGGLNAQRVAYTREKSTIFNGKVT